MTRLIAGLVFAILVSPLLSSMSAQAMPIAGGDIVTVEGTEWAQADLFTNLSWNEINAQCPFATGVCNSGSILNGHQMAGWTWASLEDVNALFNVYLVAAGVEEWSLLGPGPDEYVEDDFTGFTGAVPAFFKDWRVTTLPDLYGVSTYGLTATRYLPGNASLAGVTSFCHFIVGCFDRMRTAGGRSPSYKGPEDGAWFYQSPDSEVPIPTTPLLMALGLVWLGIRWRNSPL